VGRGGEGAGRCGGRLLAELVDVIGHTEGDVGVDAARPDVGRVHARTADALVELEELLALLEAPHEGRGRTHVQALPQRRGGEWEGGVGGRGVGWGWRGVGVGHGGRGGAGGRLFAAWLRAWNRVRVRVSGERAPPPPARAGLGLGARVRVRGAGEGAALSVACQVMFPRWLRMRVISRNIVRMTCARRGTSMLSSFSTAME